MSGDFTERGRLHRHAGRLRSAGASLSAVGFTDTRIDSRERARAAGEVLRIRRTRQFRPSLYQVYFTLLGGAIYGVLAGHAISTAVGTGLSATALAGWGPALVALFLLAAARSGTWQGPVVFSRADVAFLLMAPIALIDLVRPRLVQALAIGTVLGALGGVLVLLASAAGIGGVGGARTAGTVIAFALLGLLAVAASWLTERSQKLSSAVLRASPLLVVVVIGLVAVAHTGPLGRAIAIWSGPWGWPLAPVVGRSGWPLAVGLTALVAAGAALAAVRAAGDAASERFLAQAETRSRITASAVLLDYRSARLAHRAATAGTGPGVSRRWLRRPARPGAVVLWRDVIALTRAPARLVWAGALAAAATVEATTHPGRPLPAGLAAVTLYFAAGALLEPLRIDIDDPDKSRLLLSWPFARVLVAHCVLPVITLVIVTGLALAACVAFGSAGAGVLALIPTLLVPLTGTAVVCAALGARGGGRIGGSVLLRVMTTAATDPFGGLSAIIWVAPWLLLEIVAIGAPLLVLGGAVTHHPGRAVTGGLSAIVISASAVSVLLSVARRSGPPNEAG